MIKYDIFTYDICIELYRNDKIVDTLNLWNYGDDENIKLIENGFYDNVGHKIITQDELKSLVKFVESAIKSNEIYEFLVIYSCDIEFKGLIFEVIKPAKINVDEKYIY